MTDERSFLELSPEEQGQAIREMNRVEYMSSDGKRRRDEHELTLTFRIAEFESDVKAPLSDPAKEAAAKESGEGLAFSFDYLTPEQALCAGRLGVANWDPEHPHINRPSVSQLQYMTAVRDLHLAKAERELREAADGRGGINDPI